ncbi:hypothetical protein EBR96_04330 [bacterium]|nr:hypothetical protein [bacterium]
MENENWIALFQSLWQDLSKIIPAGKSGILIGNWQSTKYPKFCIKVARDELQFHHYASEKSDWGWRYFPVSGQLQTPIGATESDTDLLIDRIRARATSLDTDPCIQYFEIKGRR